MPSSVQRHRLQTALHRHQAELQFVRLSDERHRHGDGRQLQCRPLAHRDLHADAVAAAPQNSIVQVNWAFGGPNASGATSAVQTPSTSSGPLTTIAFNTDLKHRALHYDTTALVIVQLPGQLCTFNVPISVDPAACLACPDPAKPVTVTINAPTGPTWCAPVAAGTSATFCAQINWLQPVPMNPPAPDHWTWTVTLPDGRRRQPDRHRPVRLLHQRMERSGQC